MGIERQHGDFGFHDTEIGDEHFAQLLQFQQYLLFGYRTAHLRHRQMGRYQPHPHNIAAHHHHPLCAKLRREVFGMPRVGEACRGDILLIYRRRNQNIYFTVFQIIDCEP